MIEKLSLWGLSTGRPRPDLHLPGSPERCVKRSAAEDNDGHVWMLEKLRPGQFDRRERIGHALAALAHKGLTVPAYRPDAHGRFTVEQDGAFYQVSPYIHGDPLPQPDFIDHAERGVSLARFLADLYRAGPAIREFDGDPPFILEDYVNELMAVMAPRQPQIHDALLPVLPLLAPLFEAWNDLPHTLAHGDFHPLNVIWRGMSVAAVIDWEFAGIRPALFDVANCLGCVGIEDPMALVRGLSPALLTTLHAEGQLDRTAFRLLPEMILGLRFAWMSEWLRRNDADMAEMEVRYMRLLANSIDSLLPAWEKLLF